MFGRVNGDLRKCCLDEMRIENGASLGNALQQDCDVVPYRVLLPP